MSSLFGGSAPPPPPMVLPPPPQPVPKMPDVGSAASKETALADATVATGMSRQATDMTKKRQTLGGSATNATPNAPPTSADTFNNTKLG